MGVGRTGRETREIPDAAPLSTWAAAAETFALDREDVADARPIEGAGTEAPPAHAEAGVRCRPILLTGMHRSATSLFGRFLTHSGVQLGARLLGPLPSNPRGHFEDLDFAEIHEAAIGRWEAAGCPRRGSGPETFLADEEMAALRSLVRRRREASVPWGFKDPRAALFLDLWRREIPDALIVILLRDPMAVTDSLCRRQEQDANTVQQNDRALTMWIGYNRAILRFVSSRPDGCLLLPVTSALLAPEQTASVLAAETGYPFSGQVLSDCYEQTLLRPAPVRERPVSLRRKLEAALLYRRLSRYSHL